MNNRKLRTLSWYAKRPRMWRQFFRFVQEKRSVRPSEAALEAAKRASMAWCESVAVTMEEAARQVTGVPRLLSLAERAPAEVAAGRERQAVCPVKMGSGVDVDLIYTLAEGIGCRQAVETGVAFGWSSFALLEAVAPRGGRLISTDMPYPLRDNDAHVGCVVPERLREHWTLLRFPDRDGLPIALRRLGQVDLCHYDSDKSEAGRRWAYPRLWRALRPGGLFVTDDAQDNLEFKRFADWLGLQPLVARVPERDHFKYSGILIKPGATSG